MAEIKREPVKITQGDAEYDAFDEGHTFSDIIRYMIGQGCDAAEIAFSANSIEQEG